MSATITFTIPNPSFDGSECPLIPDGATKWEAREIRSVWVRVHDAAADVMGQVESVFTVGLSKVSYASDAQSLVQFHAARALLAARIEGCEHRLAAERARLEGDES